MTTPVAHVSFFIREQQYIIRSHPDRDLLHGPVCQIHHGEGVAAVEHRIELLPVTAECQSARDRVTAHSRSGKDERIAPVQDMVFVHLCHQDPVTGLADIDLFPVGRESDAFERAAAPERQGLHDRPVEHPDQDNGAVVQHGQPLPVGTEGHIYRPPGKNHLQSCRPQQLVRRHQDAAVGLRTDTQHRPIRTFFPVPAAAGDQEGHHKPCKYDPNFFHCMFLI